MTKFNFKYNKNSDSTKLVVINHGVSEGMNSEFIQNIAKKATNAQYSTILLQMPYFDRGEEKASQGLAEEIDCVTEVLKSIDLKQYDTIHFVGKSLGALIFNNFINENFELFDQKIEITYLGFLVEYCKINTTLSHKINIIQGENDKYGTKIQLEQLMASLTNITPNIVYIKNADHSYRNELKVPIYQDIAIESINF
jgi:predicted alpha/beta-hydrolase family hydrolase